MIDKRHETFYEVYSKDNELLWIVKTKEDAERLTQGTHRYLKVEKPKQQMESNEN